MISEPSGKALQKGLKWALGGSWGGAALQLLLMIVFARMTNPAVVGHYALATVVMNLLAPAAEAGLSQAVIQAKEINTRQIAALGWFNAIIGGVLWMLIWTMGNRIALWMNQPEILPLLYIMSFSLWLTPFGAQYGGLMGRHLRFREGAQAEWISGVVGVLVSAAGLYLGWGATAMAWGFLWRNGIAAVLAWWLVRDVAIIPWLRPARLRDATSLIRLGLWDFTTRWAETGAQNVDKLAVAKGLGAAATAYYQQAYSLFLIPATRVGAVITRVAFPLMARHQHNPDELRLFDVELKKKLWQWMTPLYLTLLLGADQLVTLLYGPGWEGAAVALRWLAAAGLLRTPALSFPVAARSLGHPEWQAGYLVVRTLLVNLLLITALHYQPVLWAAAAAWAIGEVVSSQLLISWWYKRITAK